MRETLLEVALIAWRPLFLEIFAGIILLDFFRVRAGIQEPQSAYVAFDNSKILVGEIARIGHFIDGSVAARSAQVARNSFHGILLLDFSRIASAIVRRIINSDGKRPKKGKAPGNFLWSCQALQAL